ncbi:transcription factor IIF subunit tfg1 [Marasmius crinis-equi]|uniref:Transcription factor IIF subunit tfg1 n=1 Tax=Marasmius crinis-equi TaxID=585013 RepID=A0ABR3FVY3_9AGAR
MPPPREQSLSLLFHPKKNKKPVQNSSPRRNPAPGAGTAPRPKTSSASPASTPSAVKSEDRNAPNAAAEDDTFKLPEGPYQEFKLMSSALNGWKFDVMKFDSRKVVDLATWQQPVKLNRKDLRKEDPEAATQGMPLKPMLGLDGQQVYGADGKPVMVDAEGKPVTENSAAGGFGKGKGAANGAGKKKFQKKTKQVFIVPDEIRALRREERYPWVIEDATGQETWVAQLDELSKSDTHGFFMPAATGDIFKFVPSHRWYRFQKKLKHDLPTDTMTVETAYQKNQKRDPTVWLRQRNGKGPSAATAATFKAEAEGRVSLSSGSLVQNAGSSLGPGGRKLKAVDTGSELFGDDEEDGDYKRRRQKEYGGEGDLDENVFEEEFADDDEKMEVDDNDQEAKELEERLKKEYKTANKTREGYVDESEEEEEKPVVSKQGKQMKKMLRNREDGDAYESEEEENPYASSAEEEEEEEAPPPTEGPAVMQQPQQINAKQEPTEPTIPKAASPPLQNGVATPLSPEPTSPPSPTSGHSLIAKRATSPPKVPKLKTTPSSRAGSPLAGGSRAGSPVAGAGSGSRASSPISGVNGQAQAQGAPKKRKAEDSAPSPISPNAANASSQPHKAKKRKSTIPPGGAPAPAGPLEEWMLIDWLKNSPNASTRECIQHFQPYLTDEKEKARFTALVKELASLKNGKLILKNQYRGSAGPSTPAAS